MDLVRQGYRMADYLLVIDMQEDYIGEGCPYPDPTLVQTVNEKILSYPSQRVFYVTNRFLWEWQSHKQIAKNLLKVSHCVYEKRLPSCFSNTDLKKQLSTASSLEFVGVDGNGCVHFSVLSAIKLGYQVSCDLDCIGILNKAKFAKTLQKWKKREVEIKGELS
ncbi:nicotinamidase/pyrazinamidase [Streptococcus macacae NCTC 11558]|nr:nicotinamidase/pyrazinamidase [Streptococcus macacae NCTC 11558]